MSPEGKYIYGVELKVQKHNGVKDRLPLKPVHAASLVDVLVQLADYIKTIDDSIVIVQGVEVTYLKIDDGQGVEIVQVTNPS